MCLVLILFFDSKDDLGPCKNEGFYLIKFFSVACHFSKALVNPKYILFYIADYYGLKIMVVNMVLISFFQFAFLANVLQFQYHFQF